MLLYLQDVRLFGCSCLLENMCRHLPTKKVQPTARCVQLGTSARTGVVHLTYASLFACVVVLPFQAKVPYLTAPGWAVAFLAKYNTQKLGFDIHKFW